MQLGHISDIVDEHLIAHLLGNNIMEKALDFDWRRTFVLLIHSPSASATQTDSRASLSIPAPALSAQRNTLKS